MNTYRLPNGRISWGSIFATLAALAGTVAALPLPEDVRQGAAVAAAVAGSIATKLD